jgi:hypothetical protein
MHSPPHSYKNKDINSNHEMLHKPEDTLSFNLALYGIKSMATDMLHFDNLSVHGGNLQKVILLVGTEDKS